MSNLYVTNRWEKDISFSYAFKPYVFPVNQTVEAPLEAIRHIFGYGEQDKEPYLAQLALIRTKKDVPDGIRILDKIEISEQPPKKEHSLSPVLQRVPLPAEGRVGGKLSQAQP